MDWARRTAWLRRHVPGGRRARLAIAAVLVVGTAIPLGLSTPGGPGTSFLKVAAAPGQTDIDPTTTTTTTPAPGVKPPTTRPAAHANSSAPASAKVSRAPTTIVTAPPKPSGLTTHTVPTALPNVGPAGPPLPCAVPDLALSVMTDRGAYQPGDSVEITVAAVNHGALACTLADPARTNPPDGTCQPETLVEAPWSASLPNLYEVVADVGPACANGMQLVAPRDAWRTSVTVTIPSDGTWAAGVYNVHTEWRTPSSLLSAETSFDLGGVTPLTTTTVPPTTLPPDTTTTTGP